MLNILGIMKYISFEIGGLFFGVMVGVLPYPITFLCTDLISELYGRPGANAVVWAASLRWSFFLWLGGALPGSIPARRNRRRSPRCSCSPSARPSRRWPRT